MGLKRLPACLLAGLLAVTGCTPDFSKSPTAAKAPLPAPQIASIVPLPGLKTVTSAAAIELPPGPSDSAIKGTIVMDDGARLMLRAWFPYEPLHHGPAPIRAVIVAVHGFNDHSTAFRIPSEVWRRDNIATFAYDQRGFGANPDPGRWPGSRTLAQDLATAIRLVKARYPDLPVYALGESMGGGVVLDAVGGNWASPEGRAAPDGVILAAPAVWARRTMPVYQRAVLWAAVRVIPSKTFTGSDLGVLASDNFPMLRGLGRDPLFIKATRVDSIYGLVDLMDQAIDAAPRDRLPTLTMYGAKDEVIPPEATHALVDAFALAPSSNRRFAYYADGWHMLLRDIEYPIVAQDVADWIFDHNAALSSGADKAAIAFVRGDAPHEVKDPPSPAALGAGNPAPGNRG